MLKQEFNTKQKEQLQELMLNTENDSMDNLQDY